MKFFVISILLWNDEKDNHNIIDFLSTCEKEHNYIFFRNRQTEKNSIHYKRDIENLNSIKKDDIVFLRVRLNPGGIYKYYSFGKFIYLENINSHESFNNYIQHKEENFQLINISNIITNFDGIRDKKEEERVFEISENEALSMARAITKDDNFNFEDNNVEKYINILKENYNLILTGAPGTGKTYLAKEIAAKIIFNDSTEYIEDLEENEDFKNQFQFVQFHPSYDYTDFVEGLRPVNNNGNIVFERKDGVFKEFCKKALRNLINSKKEVSELNKDTIIKNNLIIFIDDISNTINEKGYFEIEGINRRAAPLKETELNDETLYFVPDIKADKPIKLTLDKLAEFYKKFSEKLKINEKWEYQNFIDEFGYKGQHTYIYGFLKAFYEKYNSKIEKELNNNTVEKVEKKNFVFIIDEINRGEISKIFGELFFAVDPGYRGVKGKVLTQYSNLIDEKSEKYFYIPENVYIIGTMNDIDRSVESMDFAMRRRFAWKEVNAKETQYMLNTMFDNNNEITEKDKQLFIDEAKKRMNNLNKAIEQIESFNSSYHIGASYFLKLKNYYKSSSDDKK